MLEYRDFHNNVYKVIQRSVDFANEEDKMSSKEQILDDLWNIFVPTKAS